MSATFYKHQEINFADHPKYAGVRIAALITKKTTGAASVIMLVIEPQVEIPIHTHDPQVDSIFILDGEGLAYVNGNWDKIEAGDYIFVPASEEHGIRNTGNRLLKLFVHHSPPLL